MNKLIIVGNGFDLAHELPTGYCDFLNYYWTNVKNTNYNDEFISFNSPHQIEFSNVNSFHEILNQLQVNLSKKVLKTDSKGIFYEEVDPNPNYISRYDKYILGFKNNFFGTICEKQNIQNWVDIENEYYRLLLLCLHEENNCKVELLNREFNQVKKMLEEYLYANISTKYDFNLPNDEIQNILRLLLIQPLYLEDNPEHPYLKEFSKRDHPELIQLDNKIVASANEHNLQMDAIKGTVNQKNLILNFNYTPIVDKYISMMSDRVRLHRNVAFGETWQIQIHGRLNDKDNCVNFGFGDEMDDNYKLLEKKGDNEYLKNIKSFQYLQNSNYRNMLDFIDSKKFQVYIFGHSCGLSDRILLNKIFEHENCRSIKVFYHEFEKPTSDGRMDNYTEIIQNISRHFNKKEMMREKIVNKSLCYPLPQTVRFELMGSYRSHIRQNYGVS